MSRGGWPSLPARGRLPPVTDPSGTVPPIAAGPCTMSTMNTQAEWELPEPLSVADVRLDDHAVTTVRQHGNTSGPRLVVGHGNGLAADLYFPFWSLLADDYELIVYDLRNHGWNSVQAIRNHNVPTLIHDHDLVLEAIDRIFGHKPTVGVFHSLSSILPLLSFSELYSALILFDPPLCRPGASQVELLAAAEQVARRIRRRGEPVRDQRSVCRPSSLLANPLACGSRGPGTHGGDNSPASGERGRI